MHLYPITLLYYLHGAMSLSKSSSLLFGFLLYSLSPLLYVSLLRTGVCSNLFITPSLLCRYSGKHTVGAQEIFVAC